ncbi:MAG: right-handed parallel beta-helix repeat-containing protein [Verrucomicrobia bacterium]|nr:right-handed parallel beta-helix repeat-containing protein [Verrucomicrobiota bacterium]MCH8527647.1 right-handed parallel beta-helix repeat-containing protein [Kiritimatiellia bacterium]
MMKRSGVTLFFLSTFLSASTLHVAPYGDDANPGTELEPFATVTAAIAEAAPGTTIELAPGVYRERVLVSKEGAASEPIVIRGTGWSHGRPSAIVSAFEDITPGDNGFGAWENHSGSIWKITVPQSLPLGRNLVLVNGEAMRPARWPSASQVVDFDRRGMAEADSGGIDLNSRGGQAPYTPDDFYSGWYDDTDLSVFPSNHFQGAHIDLCAGHNWWTKTGVVTGNSGSRLDFRFRFAENWDPELDTPKEKDRYAVWGHLATLTEPGEFFLDVNGVNGPALTLYVWLPDSGNPSSHVISLRNREEALRLTGSRHLLFENVSIEGGLIFADPNSHDLIMDRLYLRYPALNRNQLQWGGNRAVHLMGDRNVFRNGQVLEVDGVALYTQGEETRFENNVIGFTQSHALSLDDAVNGVFEYNTAFEAGGTLVAMGAKNSLISMNHVYKAGMRSTDLAVMNTWNSGDMQGTVISYNWAHTNLAPRDSGLKWYGGQGIRLDSGGAERGCSNAVIHHNVVWGTTSESSVTAWFLQEGMENYGDSKIEVYHNTVSRHLVIGGSGSGQGHIFRRNIGERMGGSLILSGAVMADNIFWQTTQNVEADNLLANPRFTSAVTHRYTLEVDSPARDYGTPVPGITEASSGAYVGSYNPDQPAWRPGARLGPEHLQELETEMVTREDGVRVLRVYGASLGRTFPDTFTARVGGRSAMALEVMFDFVDNRSEAFLEIDFEGLSGGQPVDLSLNGVDFVTPSQSTVLVPLREVSDPGGLTGLGLGGDEITLPATSLGGDGLIRRALNTTGALVRDFYLDPVPVVVDTRAWIAEGMSADARDLRFSFAGGAGMLEHWIESGLGTEHTLIWLRAPALPEGFTTPPFLFTADRSTVFAVFGDGVESAPQVPGILPERYPLLESTSLMLHLAGNQLADTFSNGTPVSFWPNLRGGAPAEQSEPLRQPLYRENAINGLGAVWFDGGLDYLSVGGAAGLGVGHFHAFLISHVPDPGPMTWQRILSARNQVGLADWETGISIGAREIGGVAQVAPPELRAVSADMDRSRENLRIGAEALTSTGFYRGEVGEVLIFDQRLGWEDVWSISHYLDRKWGLKDGIRLEENPEMDIPRLQILVGGIPASDVVVGPGGEIHFVAPHAADGTALPSTVDIEILLPDGTVYTLANAYTYEAEELLYRVDPNLLAEGGGVPGWLISGGVLEVTTDPLLNPTPPHHVASFLINSPDSVQKDEYIGFALEELVDLRVGEAVQLTYNLRFTAPANPTASRTGTGFAYREAGLSPWQAPGNREYFFLTSYGTEGELGSLRKSRDLQFINTGDILADQQPSIDLGVAPGSVFFEMARVSPNRIRLRYQLSEGPVAEVTDAEELYKIFNRVFLRFRRATNETVEAVHLDDIRVRRLVSDRILEVPPPPSNFTVEMISSTELRVSWEPGDAYTEGYVLQRRISGGLFETVGMFPADVLEYYDLGLVPNTVYEYRVFTTGVEALSASSEIIGTSTDDQTLLVQDGFDDGSATDNPLDPLDIAWIHTGYVPTVVVDSVLDPGTPGYVARVRIDGTAADAYLGFRIPGGPRTLEVGEGLRLRYRVRFPQGARADTSRTGVSFAYAAPGRNAPWVHEENREYAFFTSFGSDSSIGILEKTAGAQFINFPAGPHLISGGQAKNLGTDPGTVEFEIFKTAEDSVRIRFRIDEADYDEYTDSDAPHITFTHVYLRYRTPSLDDANDWMVDDVELTFFEKPGVSPDVLPRDLWRDIHFPIVLENSGDSDWYADPDGDGVVNLLEYAFGGDPWTAHSLQAPRLITGDSGQVRLRLEFTREDLLYQLEASPEIHPAVWASVPGGMLPAGANSPVELDLDLDGLPRRFFRIHVEPNSP